MSQLNSVSSRYLAHLTDDQIRQQVIDKGAALTERMFPGRSGQWDTVAEALAASDSAFDVVKYPLYVVNHADGFANPEASYEKVVDHVATCRVDTGAMVGLVGRDYGVVQTVDAFQSMAILAERGDIKLLNVQQLNNGGKIRMAALLGVSKFNSLQGAPNTLGHFAVCEATHDGSASASVGVYTVRVECFNGMTSRSLIAKHVLRHTSKVSQRVDAFTEAILRDLIGDAEAETAVFESLVRRPVVAGGFETFATELLGGELTEDATDAKRTRRQNAMDELIGYFVGGNQGAGATAWGAYNSVTRYIAAKREGITDAVKAARKFNSALEGQGQTMASKALRLLTR